jgi:hypothetical protein
LNTSLLVLLDFVQADIVLAVACRGELGHVDKGN